jgi:hypothetical protein
MRGRAKYELPTVDPVAEDVGGLREQPLIKALQKFGVSFIVAGHEWVSSHRSPLALNAHPTIDSGHVWLDDQDLFPHLTVGENLAIRNPRFAQGQFVGRRAIEAFCQSFLKSRSGCTSIYRRGSPFC